MMEFLSKYSAEIVRTFFSFSKLSETEDIVRQLFKYNEQALIGITDLPIFVLSEIMSGLKSMQSNDLVVEYLKSGLEILAGPLVDVEQNNENLDAHVLLVVPKITDQNMFCVVETLTPVIFNVSNKCFEGPVRQNNLVLISCPNVKKVVNRNALENCFKNEQGFLCHKDILTTFNVNDVEWLGFPWTDTSRLSFTRRHQETTCDRLQPLIHIGGRYFLSTTTGTLNTNVGTLNIHPLAIYHFPCNVTFHDMQSSLSSCPTELSVSIPLFDETNIRYVQWKSENDDHLLDLHFKSLTIPQKIRINKTIITQFDKEIEWYDKKLSTAIKQANKKIENIKESSFTTTDEIILYVAIGLSSFNFFVLCCLYLGCTRKAEKSTKVIVKAESTKPDQKRKEKKPRERRVAEF